MINLKALKTIQNKYMQAQYAWQKHNFFKNNVNPIRTLIYWGEDELCFNTWYVWASYQTVERLKRVKTIFEAMDITSSHTFEIMDNNKDCDATLDLSFLYKPYSNGELKDFWRDWTNHIDNPKASINQKEDQMSENKTCNYISYNDLLLNKDLTDKYNIPVFEYGNCKYIFSADAEIKYGGQWSYFINTKTTEVAINPVSGRENPIVFFSDFLEFYNKN